MKQIILSIILALLLTACGAQGTTTVVEGVTVDLAVEPDPPAVGASTLHVTVLDGNGTPLEGATVAVVGNMEHEGMLPVNSETSVSVNGVYTMPFEWSMGGGWILNVTVMLPDQRGIATAQFEQFVEAISQNSIINQPPNHP